MAPRLTVVVSQSVQRDASSTDLEESLVAEIMMSPGLDATMVGPIERIEPEDTDFLCVDSFKHSFAIVSWLDVNSVVQHWERLELAGEVVSLDIPDQEPKTDKPKVLHLQLTAKDSIAQVLARLKQVLKQRSVQTFGIGLAPTKVANAKPTSIAPIQNSNVAKPTGSETKLPRGTPQNESARVEEVGDEDSAMDRQLDQLVDDFDALDL